MGIFKSLFGNKRSSGDNPPPEKTSRMMDEDRFWKMIAASLDNAEDQDEQEEYLIAQLELLPPADIISFGLRKDKLLYDTYTSNLWCAAYIINGGCSDDGFDYFRRWLISRGKEVYYKAKDNPDSLVDVIDGEDDYEFESFGYIALTAFKNKTGREMYDFIDDDNFKFLESDHPPMVFTWEENDPASIRAICPVLFEKMAQK